MLHLMLVGSLMRCSVLKFLLPLTYLKMEELNMNNQFELNIDLIRREARKNLPNGAVTKFYKFDLASMHEMLSSSIATEIICSLRYKQHYFKALQLGAPLVAQEFLEHAHQEQQHADLLATRLTQLGGLPSYNPSELANRSHVKYVECDTVDEMIRESLISERIAIDTYRHFIIILGHQDSTTRKILEDILAVEEEHADDLLELATRHKSAI